MPSQYLVRTRANGRAETLAQTRERARAIAHAEELDVLGKQSRRLVPRRVENAPVRDRSVKILSDVHHRRVLRLDALLSAERLLEVVVRADGP